MILECKQSWRDPETGTEYLAGNRYDIADAKATRVCLAAPKGAFEALGQETPAKAEPPEENPPPRAVTKDEPDQPETATARDRQARGGRARTTGR